MSAVAQSHNTTIPINKTKAALERRGFKPNFLVNSSFHLNSDRQQQRLAIIFRQFSGVLVVLKLSPLLRHFVECTACA